MELPGGEIDDSIYHDTFFDEVSDVGGNFRKVSFTPCTLNVAEDLRQILFAQRTSDGFRQRFV